MPSEAERRTAFYRIVEVRKKEIPALQEEVHAAARVLGVGTHRAEAYPGLTVVVQCRSPVKNAIDWKRVAHEIAKIHNVDERYVKKLAKRYQKQIGNAGHTTRVSVNKDRAKNPRGEAL